MLTNRWTLNSRTSLKAAPGELPEEFGSRVALEKAQAAERWQQELAELSSPANTPSIRIRAWEKTHALRLPSVANHPVLTAVARATGLSIEQVSEEQQRRADYARSKTEAAEVQAAAPTDESAPTAPEAARPPSE